eukprot:SAG11_NODE_2073_length_3858_cov_21.209364_2_plen_346_part_00
MDSGLLRQRLNVPSARHFSVFTCMSQDGDGDDLLEISLIPSASDLASSPDIGDEAVAGDQRSRRPSSGSEGDDHVTAPGSTREEIENWLRHRKTPATEIDGVLAWLSLRRRGNKRAKIEQLLGVFDVYPNLFRLAVQCFFVGEDDPPHRDAALLDDINHENRLSNTINEDGVLQGDLRYDSDSGRYSRAANQPQAPPPPDAEPADALEISGAGGSVTVPADMLQAMQQRLAAVEARGAAGADTVSRDELSRPLEESREQGKQELLRDIREGREVVDTWASKEDREKASSYKLSEDFAIFDFNPSANRSDTPNLFDVSRPDESFRRLVYGSRIREVDKTKIMRRTN